MDVGATFVSITLKMTQSIITVHTNRTNKNKEPSIFVVILCVCVFAEMYVLRIEATIYETGFKSFMNDVHAESAPNFTCETGLVAYQGMIFNLGCLLRAVCPLLQLQQHGGVDTHPFDSQGNGNGATCRDYQGRDLKTWESSSHHSF